MSDLAALFDGRGPGGFVQDARFRSGPAAGMVAPAEPVADLPDPLSAAYADGFAAGMAEAAMLAEQVAAEAEAARERLSLSFARLDAELAETLRVRMQETVVALCEASLQPLALDPDLLARRVERAIGLFVRADDERVVRLNPDDLALIGSRLPGDCAFEPDPALERGSLRVETQHGGAEDGPEQWRAAPIEALRLC